MELDKDGKLFYVEENWVNIYMKYYDDKMEKKEKKKDNYLR